MRVHYINVEPADNTQKAPRATIGGNPILPEEQKWPQCRLCKSEMIFFFQFDLQKDFDLPLQSNSHFLVFMCPLHNDVPTPLVDSPDEQLPEKYWEKTFGHYSLLLFKPSKSEKVHGADAHLAFRELSFAEAEEDIDWDGKMERGTAGFKVGGVPAWAGDAAYTRCACGGEMIFLCQLPAAFNFPTRRSAPAQPDTVAGENYNLFLGRPTYLFACKLQCTPQSVYAVSQDGAGENLAESA